MDEEEPEYWLKFTDSDGSVIWEGEVHSVEFGGEYMTYDGSEAWFWPENIPNTSHNSPFEEKTKTFDEGVSYSTFYSISTNDFESASVEMGDS